MRTQSGRCLLVVIAAVHFQQYVDFMSLVPTIGVLFVLNAAGGAGLAVALVSGDWVLRRLAALGGLWVGARIPGVYRDRPLEFAVRLLGADAAVPDHHCDRCRSAGDAIPRLGREPAGGVRGGRAARPDCSRACERAAASNS